MKTAIAIFCKTPGLSPIKTRLGVEIGKNKAEEFYKLSLSAVMETTLQVKRKYNDNIAVFIAVAEKEAIKHPFWNSCDCIWTGEGTLGERIHHIYEVLFSSFDQVLIIGSDSPQISSDYLIEAIKKLSQTNVDGIIGPCKDGGFVLFGSKRQIQKSIWTEVIYSRKDTLEQLLRGLDKVNYRYQKISELGDVDNYYDMITLINDFVQLGSKMQPQQRYLFYWLQEVLISRTFYQDSQFIPVADTI